MHIVASVHLFACIKWKKLSIPLKFLAPPPMNSIARVFIVPNFTSLQDSKSPIPKLSVMIKSIASTVRLFPTYKMLSTYLDKHFPIKNPMETKAAYETQRPSTNKTKTD